MAILQHGSRSLSLPLQSITPTTPGPTPTYGTYFYYTEDATPYLNTYWYWWTTKDINTTLVGHSTNYGLGVHYNTPTSESDFDGTYYKCGPSNMALIRNVSATGSVPTPVEMVDGQSYILVYNTSQNSQWIDTGIEFIYVEPTNKDKVLICDNITRLPANGYIGCHYETIYPIT